MHLREVQHVRPGPGIHVVAVLDPPLHRARRRVGLPVRDALSMLVFRDVAVQGHPKLTPASNQTPHVALAGKLRGKQKAARWSEANSELESSKNKGSKLRFT